MSQQAQRFSRKVHKLLLRLSLAWQFGTSFQDSQYRASCKVTYSQSGEDVIAWFIFSLLGIARPTYLDIGAHDPIFLSNTALFSLLGATGVNIEPDPALFANFTRQRPRDRNLNVGVSESPGEMTFFRMTDPTLSTFSKSDAERIELRGTAKINERMVLPVEPISQILRRLDFRPDFLSIDVEGRDLEILRSYDFEAHRPVVICAETIDFSDGPSGKKNRTLIDFVVGQGYRVYADTFINTIFVDQRRLPVS